MLSDFPTIKAERIAQLLKRARTASRARHTVLPNLRAMMQPEGDAVHFTDVEGQTAMSGYEHFQSGIQVTLAELPELDDAAWYKKIKTMTDDMADEEMKLLLRRMGEVTSETGNVVRTKGEPLSEEHLLQIFDKVQLDFVGGQVSPDFTFLTTPQMGKRLAEMENSDSFKEGYARIIARQFIDWRFRQADRKLVD